MIRVRATIDADLDLIQRWISLDPYHRDNLKNDAKFLLTGGGLLSFCLEDRRGPLCFVRLDAEGERVRLATQFGPEDEVSKRRLLLGMIKLGIPSVIEFSKHKHFKGIVFESVSVDLLKFMSRYGFVSDKNHDYVLVFEENHV